MKTKRFALQSDNLPRCICGAWESAEDWGMPGAWDSAEDWCPIHGYGRRRTIRRVRALVRRGKLSERAYQLWKLRERATWK